MKPRIALVRPAARARETRLAVFRLLVRKGPLGLHVGDVQARLDVPAPTLSVTDIGRQ